MKYFDILKNTGKVLKIVQKEVSPLLHYDTITKRNNEYSNPTSPLSLWLKTNKIKDYSEKDWWGLEIFRLCLRLQYVLKANIRVCKLIDKRDDEISRLNEYIDGLTYLDNLK